MDPIKRPTKAAIEAALSAYYSEVDEAARKNTLPEIEGQPPDSGSLRTDGSGNPDVQRENINGVCLFKVSSF